MFKIARGQMENHLYGDTHTKIFLEKFNVIQFENELLVDQNEDLQREVKAKDKQLQAKDELLQAKDEQLKQQREMIEMMKEEREKQHDKLNHNSPKPG